MTKPAEKKCPFCKEMIKAEAIKCRFCGEFLEEPPPTTGTAPPSPSTVGHRRPADGRDQQDRDTIFDGPLSKLALFMPVMKLLLWLIGAAAIGVGAFYIPEKIERSIRYGAWGLSAAIAIIGCLVFYYRYLLYRSRRFVITSDRIEYSSGLFSRTSDNCEMWRINDIRFQQTFMQRMLGIGTVIVESTDATDPEILIGPVGHAKKLYGDLRKAAVDADRRRGVVRLDS